MYDIPAPVQAQFGCKLEHSCTVSKWVKFPHPINHENKETSAIGIFDHSCINGILPVNNIPKISNLPIKAGENVVAYGYGALSGVSPRIPSRLRKTTANALQIHDTESNVQYTTTDEYSWWYGQWVKSRIMTGFISTMPIINNEHPCFGDSGGPLMNEAGTLIIAVTFESQHAKCDGKTWYTPLNQDTYDWLNSPTSPPTWPVVYWGSPIQPW